MNPRNLTREDIEELNDIEPYCFETDREDTRGYCDRNCIYSDNGRCDMWTAFAMPEDVDKYYRQLLI